MAGRARQAILVVGMHRSGTSAVTRVMNLLGVPLSPNLVPSFAGNELGHWEAAELPALHDRMLKAAGSNVNSVLGVDRNWFDSEEAERFAGEVAGYVEGAFPDTPLFALKDPRMALFIPVWRRALQRLGIEPVFVLPVRAPREVAASLTRRQLEVFTDSVWPAARGELVWLNYVLAAEHDTRDARRAFVRFDDLLDDWRREMGRLGDQLGLAWPTPVERAAAEVERYLGREHKHENSSEAAVSALAAGVLEQLQAATADPHAGAERFDAAARELEQARGLFGDYVSALESLVGSIPSLKTEFPDFPPPLERETPDDPGRLRALVLAAAAERRAQAAVIRDLQATNEALAQAQRLRAAAASAPAEELEGARQAREAALREAAEAREAQGAAALKIAAQNTRLQEQEERLRDARLAAEAAERKAAELSRDVEAVRQELAELRSSTSWKLTAPVRRARMLLSPGRPS
jgi:hypothetical protein